MKILLDESLPRKLRNDFSSEHAVSTIIVLCAKNYRRVKLRVFVPKIFQELSEKNEHEVIEIS